MPDPDKANIDFFGKLSADAKLDSKIGRSTHGQIAYQSITGSFGKSFTANGEKLSSSQEKEVGSSSRLLAVFRALEPDEEGDTATAPEEAQRA